MQGTYPGVAYGLHGMPTVTDLQSAFATLEGGHAALAVPSGLAAITLALLGTDRRRRSRAGERLGLRADAPLLRKSAQAPRRRRELLRPADRRRHRTRDAHQHARGLCRIPGLALFRGAGHSGDRGSRTRAGRAGHARQHLGHAAGLSRVRARRRYFGPRRHQVPGWPRRRAHRTHHLQRGDVSATASSVDRHGRHRERRRLLSRFARAAHAGFATAAPHGERARHRTLAARSRRGGRSRSFPRCLARAAIRCGSATSPERAVCSRSCSNPFRRPVSMPCSTACGCSRWASAGAASKA